jgi:hypothetical protein
VSNWKINPEWEKADPSKTGIRIVNHGDGKPINVGPSPELIFDKYAARKALKEARWGRPVKRTQSKLP